jgi:hypothetical protein
VSKPDIINPLPNGWREEIKIAKHFRADGSQSRTRVIRDATGLAREVWHEVVARDGTIRHGPHLKYRYQEPTP